MGSMADRLRSTVMPRIASGRRALCVLALGGPRSLREEVSNSDTDRYAAMIAWSPVVHLVQGSDVYPVGQGL